MSKRIIIFTALLSIQLFTPSVHAQTTGDFQTHQTGNWNDTNTWERWNGSSWITPAPSTPTNSDGAITILSGHTVTVTVSVSVDQVTINTSGQITVNSSNIFTIADGDGTDLTVNGTLAGAGSLTNNGSALANNGSITITAVTFNATGSQSISGSGTWTGTNITIGGSSNTSISNSISLAITGTLTINSGGTLDVGSYTFTISGTKLDVAGTLTGTGTVKTQGTLTLSQHGTFSPQLKVASGTTTKDWAGAFNGSITIDAGATLSINELTTANANITNDGILSGVSSKTLTCNGETFTNNGTISTLGTIAFNGSTFINNSSITNNTVQFSKTGSQSISGTGTWTGANITIGGSSNTSLSNSISVAITGTFIISSGGIFDIGSSTFTISGTKLEVIGTLTGAGTVKTQGTLTFSQHGTFSTQLNVASGTTTKDWLGALGGSITIDEGATLSLNEPTTASANITNNGTISGWSSRTLTCNGESFTNNGTISTLSSIVFNGSTFINNGSIAINSNFSRSGSQALSGTGSFSSSYTTTINSGSTVTLGSNHYMGKVTINAGGSMDISSRTLYLSGAGTPLINNGTFTTTGSTIGYNGSASQTIAITNITYNNLTINNSAGVTLSSAKTIPGILTLSTGTFTVGSNLTLANGATISRDAGALSDTPTFGSSVHLFYTGSTGVTTSYELPSSSSVLNNLTINNSGGITLNSNATVNETLTITSGNITTGSNILTLGSGTGSPGTLLRTSGTIIGNFKRWFSAVTVSNILFPIGTTGNYRPANINFTTAPSSGGSLTAFFTASNPGTTGLPLNDAGTSIQNIGTDGYWTLTSGDGLTGGNYSLDLTADGFSGVNDYSTLRILKRSTSGSWTLDGTHSTGTGSNTTPVVHRTSMASFSEFGIGGASDNFPAAEIFTDISASLTGVYEGSVAWGDYDNDGDLDLLITGHTGFESISKIYRNDSGSFVDIGASLTGVNLSSVAWGDYDNDGDLDIILTGTTNSIQISKIYRNDGGSFVDIGASLIGIQDGSVAWGDYDNDGDLDLLLTGTDGSQSISKIYRNDGGSFVDIGASLTGVRYSSVAWGDYDNDGDLDIILTGITSSSAFISKIYRNDSGSFVDIGVSLPGVYDGSVAWGDYDNDGDLDLLLTGFLGNIGIAKIYHNDGGSFVDIGASLTGLRNGSVAWGDYDNDGDLDILLASSSPTYITKVYRNDSGSFVDIGVSLPGVYGGSVAWGDYDNDGDIDILVTGYDGSSVISKIYRNSSATSNTAPSAPSNLSTSISGSDVTFSWNKSTDSQTPQNGLSYNLMIGTNENGVNIFSPMSNPTSGYRKIVKTGPIQTNSWTIKNLPAGYYYWGVQAIDGAFAGSSFATISNTPIPVELTSFDAEIKGNSVLLKWQTATEINNYGFNIERRINRTEGASSSAAGGLSASWETLGFVQGHGNSNSPKEYLFTDENTISGKIKYRLKQIDYDGKYEYSKEVEVDIEVPKIFFLKQNFPNPFNPTTTIEYQIPAASYVSLKVYNNIGQEISSLINAEQKAGYYKVSFDGSGLASGVYFYTLTSGNKSLSKKLLLMK